MALPMLLIITKRYLQKRDCQNFIYLKEGLKMLSSQTGITEINQAHYYLGKAFGMVDFIRFNKKTEVDTIQLVHFVKTTQSM
ncbi:MAG: hypothetical protein H7Z13_11695 [Ferruginibacter sp.]|nr:hypothetical protein [Ferruginibacter sp.]